MSVAGAPPLLQFLQPCQNSARNPASGSWRRSRSRNQKFPPESACRRQFPAKFWHNISRGEPNFQGTLAQEGAPAFFPGAITTVVLAFLYMGVVEGSPSGQVLPYLE
ncbi:hypothetical protein RhiJN_03107 [Ceratobasidium sp. AG-Ba]|nr:hypothetical protein RhiJN_03107 [Ceratobasidium sp. AG-Ba]